MGNIIIMTTLRFTAFYVITLALWLSVQNYYGVFIVEIVAPLIASVKGISSELIMHTGNDVTVTFAYRRGGGTPQVMDIIVKTSFYSFSAPLTFAILSAYYPFLRRNATFSREFASRYGILLFYLQILGALFVFHVVIVFFMIGKDLSVLLADMAVATSRQRVEVWRFVGQFIEYIVKRAEPLLVGFYIYIRFFYYK
ncbi:membrane protein [Candidatus Magnetobacterium bavaricum]|uniref:Membrane protein n=1 Tax=Candidatus Magnetobacterium bavaricum TaxID=29290 RepID=A0A0F3H002_9BACT|nr:membrane protein [Candidatus Magnetobacterium bavaricum]